MAGPGRRVLPGQPTDVVGGMLSRRPNARRQKLRRGHAAHEPGRKTIPPADHPAERLCPSLRAANMVAAHRRTATADESPRRTWTGHERTSSLLRERPSRIRAALSSLLIGLTFPANFHRSARFEPRTSASQKRAAGHRQLFVGERRFWQRRSQRRITPCAARGAQAASPIPFAAHARPHPPRPRRPELANQAV